MSEIQNQIEQLINKYIQTNRDSILLTTNFFDYGLESIELVQFVIDLENYFGITILDSDLLSDNFADILCVEETIKKYIMFKNSICKCIILDADGILWDGIAGEEGSDSVTFKDVHYRFHALLRKLLDRGIVICLCTSNTKENILPVLQKNNIPEDMFIIVKYNQERKVVSINEVLQVTEYLPENVLFVDDSYQIIEEVENQIKDINAYCIRNVQNLVVLFESLLSVSTYNSDKMNRTDQFRQHIERSKLYVDDVHQYNMRLHTEIDIVIAKEHDAERITELSQRANRFNISGNHLEKETVLNYITSPLSKIYKLTARDKFGDMGMVAFMIVKEHTIQEFVVSCRAFYRGFEDELLKTLSPKSKYSFNLQITKKNAIAVDFVNRICAGSALSC